MCAVMLLAGCGGSSGSASDTSTPVIRGDVAASSLTVTGSPATAAVGTHITLTSAGGTGTEAVSYSTTSDGCKVIGAWLKTNTAGTCAVTATQGMQTGTATFTFTAAASSSDVSVPGTPPAPTVVAGDRKITVTVARGTSGGTPTSYRVYVTKGDTNGAEFCVVTGASGSCIFTGLTPGSTYRTWAHAANAAGLGYASELTTVTLPAMSSLTEERPGRPSAPTVVAGDGKVTSTVAAGNLGGAPASYTVTAYNTLNGTAAGTCTVTGESGSCAVTALTAGSTYTVTATAKNSAGDSGESNPSSSVTVPVPTVSVPGTPPAPTVVAGDGKITVTVAPGTSGGTPASYYVTAYTANGTSAGRKCTVTGASGFCEVTPLTAGSTYTVKAIAMNSAGNSGESVASSPVTVVAPLRTVTFNANGGTETMENQTANKSTPLKENVFKRSGYVFDGWSTTLNGDKAYGVGDNYTFGESATLYARWAAVPSTVTAPAATVPGAPELTSIARKSGTEVWVTFSAPSSTGGAPITEYTVTVKGPNGRILTQSFPAQAGKVPVGPLNNKGFYTFTVRAVNAVGTSEPSNRTRILYVG